MNRFVAFDELCCLKDFGLETINEFRCSRQRQIHLILDRFIIFPMVYVVVPKKISVTIDVFDVHVILVPFYILCNSNMKRIRSVSEELVFFHYPVIMFARHFLR